MLNVDDILDKGLKRESLLTDHEQLIFAIAYLESLSDMEGWDHFFIYNFNWYSKLIEALELSDDQLSLNVLNDYKQHFIKLGVPFQAKKIDGFLLIADEQYFENCIDWRESFYEIADQRWNKVQLYFNRLGFELIK